MEKYKKILSVLLIIMLMVVQLVPILNVKAEGTTITMYGENEEGINPNLVTNEGRLCVYNVDNGDEFAAYKIIDVFYDKETNEMTYDFTSNFKMFLNQAENYGDSFTVEKYFALTSDNPDGSASTSVITTSTLNILVSKYTTYIRNNNIKSDKELITNSQVEVRVAAADVVAGAYLIIPTKVNTGYDVYDYNAPSSRLEVFRNMYGVIVANVVFSSYQGNWVLNRGDVYAKKTENEFDTMLFEFSLEQYNDYINGIDIGDVSLYYQQNISSYSGKKYCYTLENWEKNFNFPTNAISKHFVYTIEVPEGLDYDKATIGTVSFFGDQFTLIKNRKVVVNGSEIGTISFVDNKIIIEITQNEYFLLGFSFWLNDKAIVGDAGNVIKTTLTVTDDPYVENSTTNLELENTIYTYGLELTNLSKDDSILLKGAKYEIYSKYTDSDLKNKIGEFTVGEDGKASFAGVPAGTIYLKQVKAPIGYQLIKEPIAVEIATEGATAGTKEGYYKVITYNDTMWYLPSTGGIGTILYTVIGLLVIGLSTYAIVYYRKKKFN